MCHRFHRFMHKHPEDPSEVPNGFLSDINPVSDPAHSIFMNLLKWWISNVCFFFSLELPGNNQQCLSWYFSQGSKSFGQIPVWKGRLLFCWPRQHWRKGKEVTLFPCNEIFQYLYYFRSRLGLKCNFIIMFFMQLVFNRTVTLKEDPGKLWSAELQPGSTWTHILFKLYSFIFAFPHV